MMYRWNSSQQRWVLPVWQNHIEFNEYLTAASVKYADFYSQCNFVKSRTQYFKNAFYFHNNVEFSNMIVNGFKFQSIRY